MFTCNFGVNFLPQSVQKVRRCDFSDQLHIQGSNNSTASNDLLIMLKRYVITDYVVQQDTRQAKGPDNSMGGPDSLNCMSSNHYLKLRISF